MSSYWKIVLSEVMPNKPLSMCMIVNSSHCLDGHMCFIASFKPFGFAVIFHQWESKMCFLKKYLKDKEQFSPNVTSIKFEV